MPPEPAPPSRSSRTQRQLWVLTLLAILYLSLYPFTGWGLHRPGMLSWLGAGIPRYYSAGDLLVNVLAYAGFGYLSVRLVQVRLALGWAVLAVTLAAALLSFGMESLQSFLPRRVPSLLDLLANAAGGLLGALLAAGLSLARSLMQRRLPDTWTPDSASRCSFHESERSHKWLALLLIFLWLVAQFSPQPLLLVNAPLSPWPGEPLLPATLRHWHLTGPWLIVSTHFLAMSTVLMVGLLLLRLLPGSRVCHPLLSVLVLLAIALRISSSLRVYGDDPAGWLGWLPVAGMLAGLLLLHGLRRSAPEHQRWAAIALALATPALALLVPPDPEFAAALRRTPTLLMRTSTPGFRSLLRALAAAWPLAVLYFFVLETPNSSAGQPRSAVGKASPTP